MTLDKDDVYVVLLRREWHVDCLVVGFGCGFDFLFLRYRA